MVQWRKPAAAALAVWAAWMLAGCGASAVGSHAVRPTHPQRTALPLSLARMAMGSAKDGRSLPVAGPLPSQNGGADWVGLGPPGVTLGGGSSASSGTSGLLTVESFPSPSEAVVATKKPSGAAVHVYVTTDGGKRWRQADIALGVPAAANLSGGSMYLDFASTRRGWLLLISPGLAGSLWDALWGTTDGGQHWRPLQTSKAPGFLDVTAAAFGPTGFGVASTNSPAFDSARVLTTSSSGARWSATRLPLPTYARQTQAQVGAPSLSASGTAWVPVTLQRSGTTEQLLLYTTADGGRRWTERAWPTPIPVSARVVLVAGDVLTLAYGGHTHTYRLSLSAGVPAWTHLATLNTPSPTAAALAALAGGG